MEQPIAEPNELGYSFNTGGLNNQVLALLGLFCRGYEERRPIVLPLMTVLDHVSRHHIHVRFREVFDIEPMLRLGNRHHLIITDRDPNYFDKIQVAPEQYGWKYFGAGAAKASEMARGIIKYPELVDFIFDFFDHLVPLIRMSSALSQLKKRAFLEKEVNVVAQFRIETDWKRHTDLMKSQKATREDLYLPPIEIVQKIVRSIPGVKSMLVTSDEAAMPWSKEEIASSCRDAFGVELFWKSDLLSANELAPYDNLQRSLIDQEMAVSSQHFVGITRSTFANMATFFKFVRTRQHVTSDYFYNTEDDLLRQRKDNGGWDHPPWAARPWEHPHYGWRREEDTV